MPVKFLEGGLGRLAKLAQNSVEWGDWAGEYISDVTLVLSLFEAFNKIGSIS